MQFSGKLPIAEMRHHPSEPVDRDDGGTVQVAAPVEVQGKMATGWSLNDTSWITIRVPFMSRFIDGRQL
jgi:hypothetical protein